MHKSIYRQLELDDTSYRAIELPEERLKSFFSGFRVGGFDGVNVTIPHKQAVIQLLDEVDVKAKVIGAVNCINRSNNQLVGYNTDVLGFTHTLRTHSIDVEGKDVLLIGAGGSAKAVAAAFAQQDVASVTIANRTKDKVADIVSVIGHLNRDVKTYASDLDELESVKTKFACVVNTTSVGMHPEIEHSPITDVTANNIFKDKAAAVDLIYNPLQTQFLKQADSAGAGVALNGIEMLVAQAVYSVEIWMGGNIVTHVDMRALTRELERSFR